MRNKEKEIILNYCAYSAIGRISMRFPNEINGLLNIIKKNNCKQEIITQINTLDKKLVPLFLVLLKYLKTIDYYKLNYLFQENDYLEVYFKKIVLNKKPNKKDQLISEYISYLFKVPKPIKTNQSRLKKLTTFIDSSNLHDKTAPKLKFIFLETIKGVSCGYGNFNYVIIESNVFPEELIIHEIIHNYIPKEKLYKIIKPKNAIQFNEIFTSVVSQATYCKFMNKPIIFKKYYYSTKREQKLENRLRKCYFEWTKLPNSSFLNYLKSQAKIFKVF